MSKPAYRPSQTAATTTKYLWSFWNRIGSSPRQSRTVSRVAISQRSGWSLPGTCRARSMSRVAILQYWSRHIAAISLMPATLMMAPLALSGPVPLHRPSRTCLNAVVGFSGSPPD